MRVRLRTADCEHSQAWGGSQWPHLLLHETKVQQRGAFQSEDRHLRMKLWPVTSRKKVKEGRQGRREDKGHQDRTAEPIIV